MFSEEYGTYSACDHFSEQKTQFNLWGQLLFEDSCLIVVYSGGPGFGLATNFYQTQIIIRKTAITKNCMFF